MTTPTTGITMSSIQTEFGGANPINMSEYVKGGSYVPSGQATSATDGTAIPTSASGMRMGMFRGLTKVSAGVSSTWTGGNQSVMRLSAGAATASASFDNNGQTYGNPSAVGVSNVSDTTAGKSWYLPNTASIGSSYWIRATLVSGSPPTSGTLNTWTSLNSVQAWTYTVSGSAGASAQRTGTLQFQIASDSGGSNIVLSGNVYFSALKDV